jgi:serine/threonine-protein kinase RsbW
LREALANALIQGNHENPRKQVYVRCRCKLEEVSIAVKEGRGSDVCEERILLLPKIPDPFMGRGIYLMKELMDECASKKGSCGS